MALRINYETFTVPIDLITITGVDIIVIKHSNEIKIRR